MVGALWGVVARNRYICPCQAFYALSLGNRVHCKFFL